MSYIPYGRQDITPEDEAAVLRVLKSDFITQGPEVPNFEASLTTYCKAQYGVVVNSATSALHVACLALGLSPGDILWTSPITFVASANAALYCGATVSFTDIDPKTYNMCPDSLEKKLIQAERLGTLPKIVVPVHLCGQSCDMARIYSLSRKYGFSIIEDASHAIGSSYNNRPVGSCDYSDVCVFSFHPVKIITTAEGGAAITNDREIADRMRLYRSHGVTRDHVNGSSKQDDPWFYEQVVLGYNYRMTELQAALGSSQMARLDAYIQKRHVVKDVYDKGLNSLPITLPWQAPYQRSSLHLYPILVLDESPLTRRELFDQLRDAGFGVNVHYIPVYWHPHHACANHSPEDYPNAEDYYARTISIPMFPTLNTKDQELIINTIQRLLS